MPFMPRPAALLFAAALFLIFGLIPTSTARADAWQGPGVQLQVDPQQPNQARLTLNGRTVPASVARAANGSVTGTFTFGNDPHTYTLSAPGPNGQRTFAVGQHTATLNPVASGTPRPDARPPTPSGQPAGTLRLRQHTLVDKGMGNMPSHKILVPAGWKVEGGGWWAGQGYYSVLPSHDVTVTSPEGVEVELSPEIGFKHFQANPNSGFNLPPQQTGQADGGYPVMEMPEGPEGWRQWLLQTGMPQAYPDATNVQVRDIGIVQELQPVMQQLVGPLQQNAAQQNQMNQQMGMPGGNFADGAFYAVNLTFERDGRRWEQLTLVGVYWLGSTMEYGRQLWWGMLPGRTFTVPEGKLATYLPTLVAVADSLQTTPQWAQMKHEHAAKLAGISAKGARDRAEIARKGMENVRRINQETSDIIAGGYDANSGMSAQRKFVNSIHEVDDYADPTSGNTVQLPSGYESVYSNSRGEYLLTNDVLNDPNTLNLDAGTWTQMNTR